MKENEIDIREREMLFSHAYEKIIKLSLEIKLNGKKNTLRLLLNTLIPFALQLKCTISSITSKFTNFSLLVFMHMFLFCGFDSTLSFN